MKKLIDAGEFYKAQKERCGDGVPFVGTCSADNAMLYLELKNAPTVEAVPKGAYEQVKWERDMAMEQLQEHGIPFGGKADLQAVRHGKWIMETWVMHKVCCSECGGCTHGESPYCPYCGCRMDGD